MFRESRAAVSSTAPRTSQDAPSPTSLAEQDGNDGGLGYGSAAGVLSPPPVKLFPAVHPPPQPPPYPSCVLEPQQPLQSTSALLTSPPASTPHLPPPAVARCAPRHQDVTACHGAVQKERESSLPILAFSDKDRALIEQTVREVVAFGHALHSSHDLLPDKGQVYRILEEAHRAASEVFGMEAAKEWGGNFVFPPDVFSRDATRLQSLQGDIVALIGQHHNERAHLYLSEARVTSVFGADGDKIRNVSLEDFRRVLKLAREGIHIMTPPEFHLCGSPPPFRTKYLAVAPAVHKVLYDQFVEGSVLVIPTERACAIPGIHFSVQHWALKKNKPQGRVICDVSNTEDDETTPLNGSIPEGRLFIQEACTQEWGSIHLPTIDDIGQMILRVADNHGGLENIELWSTDLRGAFTLLRMAPGSSLLLAFALSCDLTIIHLCGMFGWVGLPYAFAVISRLLQCVANAKLRGGGLWYVDDCIGAAKRTDVTRDMSVMRDYSRELLGPTAIAQDKEKRGRRLDALGWCIDLDSELVTMSRRNFLKTVHAFFSFDVSGKVSRRQMEVMASLASRYSMLCRPMKPHVHDLYASLHSFGTEQSNKRHLTAQTRRAVCVWRSFLILLNLNESSYARTLRSFRYLIEYDASLTGLACGISKINEHSQIEMIAFTAVTPPFTATQDSSYQNTYEYLAVLLAILMAHCLHIKVFSYALTGDSVSSLSWCQADQARSALAYRANLAFTLASVATDATVDSTQFITSESNEVYDGLSRGLSAEQVGLDPRHHFHLHESHPVVEFLRLCDPTAPVPEALDCALLTGRFIDLLRQIEEGTYQPI